MSGIVPVVACENNGQCRFLYFEKWGLNTDLPFGYGENFVTVDGTKHKYVCCTHCHKAKNPGEAARINGKIGASAQDIVLDLDDDFLNALDRALDD